MPRLDKPRSDLLDLSLVRFFRTLLPVTHPQVRIWDAITRSLLRMTKLDTPASSLDYSPDGEHIVVGMGARAPGGRRERLGSADGGGSARGWRGGKRGGEGGGSDSPDRPSSAALVKNGGFAVLRAVDLVLIFEAKDAKEVSGGGSGRGVTRYGADQ